MCVNYEGVKSMTVLPGSLDYLYYQGILDHIPYEAYEMPYAAAPQMPSPSISGSDMKQMIMSGENTANVNNIQSNTNIRRQRNNFNSNSLNQNSMNASQYLDSAKQGMIYDAYGSGDSFIRNGNSVNYGTNSVSNSGGASGYGSVYDLKAQTLGESSGKNSSKKESKDPVLGSSSWKGLLAAGLIILTPILLIKGLKRKKP